MYSEEHFMGLFCVVFSFARKTQPLLLNHIPTDFVNWKRLTNSFYGLATPQLQHNNLSRNRSFIMLGVRSTRDCDKCDVSLCQVLWLWRLCDCPVLCRVTKQSCLRGFWSGWDWIDTSLLIHNVQQNWTSWGWYGTALLHTANIRWAPTFGCLSNWGLWQPWHVGPDSSWYHLGAWNWKARPSFSWAAQKMAAYHTHVKASSVYSELMILKAFSSTLTVAL